MRRNPALTIILEAVLKNELKDKNFANTKNLREKFQVTGHRVAYVLRKLGWSWYSQGDNYQVYKRDSYELEG